MMTPGLFLLSFCLFYGLLDACFLYSRKRKQVKVVNAPARFFRPARHRRSGGTPKPPWVLDTILRLHAESGMSYREIMHTFNRLHAHQGVTVCLDTVYRWVQKHHSEMEAVRKATRNRFPVFTPANSL